MMEDGKLFQSLIDLEKKLCYDYDYDLILERQHSVLVTSRRGGDPQNKKGVNYNKSSPKIQLLNCSSDSVSMM